MPIPTEVEEISGATGLYEWFGYWPDFHDAEILSLYLNRSGPSILQIYTWDTTKEIDARGFYVQRKHAVVEFVLNGMAELDLNGFSCQNVISGLAIERTSSGFRVVLGACYGLAGSLEAETLAFRITPGKPSE